MPPSEELEYAASSGGFELIAGVDEVGVGCLAGPVVAAAVMFERGKAPVGIDDSKKLTPIRRQACSLLIEDAAITFALGTACVEEIDSINIFHATRLAMVRALDALDPSAEFVLVDGKVAIPHRLPQRAVVGGDRLSVSVAAASILAKVYRDRLMVELDEQYPGYGFAKHKGYASLEHRKALSVLGQCPIHRKSFSWTPVREDRAEALRPSWF